MMAKRKLKLGNKLRHRFGVLEHFHGWGYPFNRANHLEMGRLAVAPLEISGFFEFAALTNSAGPGSVSVLWCWLPLCDLAQSLGGLVCKILS